MHRNRFHIIITFCLALTLCLQSGCSGQKEEIGAMGRTFYTENQPGMMPITVTTAFPGVRPELLKAENAYKFLEEQICDDEPGAEGRFVRTVEIIEETSFDKSKPESLGGDNCYLERYYYSVVPYWDKTDVYAFGRTAKISYQWRSSVGESFLFVDGPKIKQMQWNEKFDLVKSLFTDDAALQVEYFRPLLSATGGVKGATADLFNEVSDDFTDSIDSIYLGPYGSSHVAVYYPWRKNYEVENTDTNPAFLPTQLDQIDAALQLVDDEELKNNLLELKAVFLDKSTATNGVWCASVIYLAEDTKRERPVDVSIWEASFTRADGSSWALEEQIEFGNENAPEE